MRIISGSHRGKKIQAPKYLSARPTTDMAKEALFNILNNRIYFEECDVLDLYAGTGNISYEFASRGAKSVVAVDRDSKSASFISKTARELNFPIRAIKSEVLSYLKKARGNFDIIFADPPYQMDLEEFAKIPRVVFDLDLLRDQGMLIIEHSKHTDLSELPGHLENRKYGGSVFSFFGLP